MWTRSISLLELYSYGQVIQSNGSTISSFLFKSSSEFLICCIFKNSSSSSFFYTFASHSCNIGYHTIFFCPLILFKSLSNHATIVVHENCWDSLKAPPDFFTFMGYSCGMWVITKTFPAVQDVNGTSAKTFSRHAL